MNNAQIKKLQNKVAQKLKTKQDLDSNNVVKIIVDIEKRNPNRGKCACLYKNSFYKVKNGKLVLIDCVDSNFIRDNDEYELIEANGDRKYYLQTIEAINKYKKIIDWMAKNFALIKIAESMAKSDEAGKRLEGMHLLGSVSIDFSENFPDKSLYDLKNLIVSFEKFFIAQ